jgi:hypothetical protein
MDGTASPLMKRNLAMKVGVSTMKIKTGKPKKKMLLRQKLDMELRQRARIRLKWAATNHSELRAKVIQNMV